MRIGELRHQVNVLREQTRSLPSGATASLGWTKYHRKMPAAKEDVGGGETTQGPQTIPGVDSIFKIRFVLDLLTTDRIECDGAQYEIKALLDREGKRQWLEVPAAKVAPVDLGVVTSGAPLDA